MKVEGEEEGGKSEGFLHITYRDGFKKKEKRKLRISSEPPQAPPINFGPLNR